MENTERIRLLKERYLLAAENTMKDPSDRNVDRLLEVCLLLQVERGRDRVSYGKIRTRIRWIARTTVTLF